MDRGIPFDELERLLERLDEARGTATSGLAVDVRDDGDAFALVADLPGFDSGDIDVAVQNRTVHVDAAHSERSGADAADYVRRERSKGSVSRSVTLPESVESAEAAADYSNGVLTVTLPKAQATDDATTIEVE